MAREDNWTDVWCVVVLCAIVIALAMAFKVFVF